MAFSRLIKFTFMGVAAGSSLRATAGQIPSVAEAMEMFHMAKNAQAAADNDLRTAQVSAQAARETLGKQQDVQSEASDAMLNVGNSFVAHGHVHVAEVEEASVADAETAGEFGETSDSAYKGLLDSVKDFVNFTATAAAKEAKWEQKYRKFTEKQQVREAKWDAHHGVSVPEDAHSHKYEREQTKAWKQSELDRLRAKELELKAKNDKIREQIRAVTTLDVDQAFYRSVDNPDLSLDVRDRVNHLISLNGLENFTACQSLNSIAGDPAFQQSKELVVTRDGKTLTLAEGAGNCNHNLQTLFLTAASE